MKQNKKQKQAPESAQYEMEISFKEFNNLLLCFVSLYLQMQLDAIKLIALNKRTWKLSSVFHPVCSNNIGAQHCDRYNVLHF